MARRSRRTTLRARGYTILSGIRSRRRIKRLKIRLAGAPSRQRRRSSNHWHQHTPNLYSKAYIRDVELLWLEDHCQDFTITLRKVPDCERMPSYKTGQWDGFANFVEFKNQTDAMMFKIAWWNTRI